MSIIGLSMGALPCCAKEDVEAGSAALRVDWPVYPRRAEHNTVAEGGNRRWAELWARALHPDQPENGVAVALPRAPQRAQPVEHRAIQPDQAVSVLIDLVLETDVAERKGSGNRLERRLRVAMRIMGRRILGAGHSPSFRFGQAVHPDRHACPFG
jgi:hypothetical protein